MIYNYKLSLFIIIYYNLFYKPHFEDDEDTETEFARLLNEETEAEKLKSSQLKRSNRGAENLDIEEDYIPVVAMKEPNVEKVTSSG